MEEKRRGRWVKAISQHEEEWENILALVMIYDDLTGLIKDLDELSIRCHQVLHRRPEMRELIQPGLDRIESMRKTLLQTRERYKDAPQLLLKWREEEAVLREAGKLDK